MTTLLAEQPPVWEHLLFAGLLAQGRDARRLAWRDHVLEIPSGPYRRVDADDLLGVLSAEMDHLRWIIEPLERVFAAQEDAFGKPGEPGDPELIRHFANWVLRTFDALLSWAAGIRNLGVPEAFRPVVGLWAHHGDLILDEIRAFIDRAVEDADALTERLAKQDGAGNAKPIHLDLTLSVGLDQTLSDEALASLTDAVRAQAEIDADDPGGA